MQLSSAALVSNIPHRWSNIWQRFQKLLEVLWIYHLLPLETKFGFRIFGQL